MYVNMHSYGQIATAHSQWNNQHQLEKVRNFQIQPIRSQYNHKCVLGNSQILYMLGQPNPWIGPVCTAPFL